MNDTENQNGPDLTELGELCGCTAKQIKFAEGMLQGMNQTQAAAHAGYAGEREGAQLRSAGSSAARAKPVMALLALAASHGMGVPNCPGDGEELERILWSHARSKDPAHSIKATIELERLRAAKASARDADALHDPIKTIEEIAQISVSYAIFSARKHDLEWHPTAEQLATAEREQRDFRTVIEQETAFINKGNATHV